MQWNDLFGSAMKTYTVIQDGVNVMTGINTTNATVDGLISNEYYEFQVKASNSAGCGHTSNIATLATSQFILVNKISYHLF